MIKIFKHVFKTKINFPTAQKFVGFLILFSIALQVLTPLGALATHQTTNESRRWHNSANTGGLAKLSDAEFDFIVSQVNTGEKNGNIYRHTIESEEEALNRLNNLSENGLKNLIKRSRPDGGNANPTHENPANNVDSVCDYNFFPSIECLVTRGIGWVSYVVLQAVSYLLFISAKIFDLSAQLSLDYRAYSAKTAVPVYLGWRAARDFVNILFIFIILIIALALILQVQQYYSRQVLVKLVGVALFINFSFFLCQQIINFTNSAAIYFKDRVTGCKSDDCRNNWELSKIFVEALNPQQMLNNYTVEVPPLRDSDTTGTEAQYAKFNKTMQEKSPGIIAMIIATFGGITIMLAASFVMLAAAGMFLLRLVMLWNIIILAPIAITASILPVTQRHFSAWWTRFTREAFFAPAMMFMFYIEMSILKQGFLRDFVKGNAPSDANVLGSMGTTFTFNFYLIAIYILMMMLFVKALFVARNMSAMGADAIWRGGKKAIKWGTGDHGKKPLYAIGRFARSRAAPTAERITTGEGKIGGVLEGTLGKFTGIKAGARKIVKDERSAVEAKTKKWEGLTNDEKAKELSLMKTGKYTDRLKEGDMAGLSIAKMVALVQSLQKTGGLGKVDKDTLKTAHTYLKSRGMDTKDLETYMPSLAKNDKDREKAIQRQQTDKVSDYLQITDQFDYAKNPENKNLHLKYWGEGQIKEMFKAVETGDKNALSSAKGLLGAFSEYGDSMDNIINGLEKNNNNSAARFLKTAEGERMFQTMADKTGVVKPARGTYASKAQAKEDLQLEDRNLVENVILDKNKLNIDNNGAQRTFEIVREANDERLSDIVAALQTISPSEQSALVEMIAEKDKNEAKKIININPTIIQNVNQTTRDTLGLQTIQEVVDRMPSKKARYMTHDALMNEEVIKALSKPQLMNLAEFNIPTKEERNKIINTLKTPIITLTGAPQTAVSDEIKNYMEINSYWGNKPWENRR